MTARLHRYLLITLGLAVASMLVAVLTRFVPPPGEPPDVQRLTQALAQVQLDGQGEAVSTGGLVVLPYLWDNRHRGRTGTAEFTLNFDYDLAGDDDAPTLYIPRLGNTYQLVLNGFELVTAGNLSRGQASDYAKQPLLRQLSRDIVRETGNKLTVRIRADMGRRGGLSAVFVGPYKSVQPMFSYDYRWRVLGSGFIVMVTIFFAAIGVALWASQPHQTGRIGGGRDPIYGFLVIAELAWAIRVGDALIESPPLPWPYWGIVHVFAMAAWAAALTYFFAIVGDWQRMNAWRYLRWWINVLLVLCLVASWLALAWGEAWALTAWYGLMALTFLAFVLVNLRYLVRGSPVQRILVLALLINVLVGFYDLYAFRVSSGMGTNTWMRYSALLFGASLTIAAIARFRAVSQQAQELTRSLNERVAAREQELAQSYARLEHLARDQARSQERGRILKDMHDGVGVHLSTAIRQLRSGSADSDELLRTLTDSLDQLKLSIDAMQFEPGDVGAMLAALRYRLEPRLKAGGIALHWTVDELPVLGGMDVSRARNLQFLLFGAISNVLQHAQAAHLTVSARREEHALRIVIEDDGQGFDPALTPGRGLQAMRERAAALAARLDVHSSDAGTRVELSLPV